MAQQIYTAKPIKGIMEVDLTFIMPIPKSMEGRAKKVDALPHTKKPDIDSLTRFAIKNLEGIVYRESGQIIRINAIKLYGHVPETRLSLRKMTVDEFNEQYEQVM